MKLTDGMVAVITGGASGIGLALAEALLDRGLNVAIADVEQQALDALRSRLPRDRVLLHRTDVSRLMDVQALRDATLARFGRIDILCNNAGVFSCFKPMWTFDMRDWTWVIGVNLWGVINGIHAFVPGLVEQGHGYVVNVASLAGMLSLPGNGPYNAAKHGVVTVSEGLRAELAEAGVDVGVSVVCPGWVATNIRSAVRNRPAELTPDITDDTLPDAIDDGDLPPESDVLPPSVVAQQIIAAIEAGRLYVATHPGFEDVIRAQRVDAMLEGIAIV